MRFKNREAAAQQLARKLAHYRGRHPLVLAVPRGAAVMARIIADELDGEMDVVLVRKLRAPGQPELAIGAIDEHGHVILTGALSPTPVSDYYLEQEEVTQLDALRQRRAAYARLAANARGRVVIVVDDGIATGFTMIAALKSVREQMPAKLVVAAAVAPPDTVGRLLDFADEVVCLDTPADFHAVGQFFDDFHAVSDAEVVALLQAEERQESEGPETIDSEIAIDVGGLVLGGHLTRPEGAKGIVVFVHGSGSSRANPRNRHVAEVLNQHGVATLLFDLLTREEDRTSEHRFDVALLKTRLLRVTEWVSRRSETRGLPIGYFGASTGAAAAMAAAVELRGQVACIVARGGRPDLAMDAAKRLDIPTLLIVGGDDPVVIEFNRKAHDVLAGIKELSIVHGAGHLFEEPGALDEVARLAADWFCAHLGKPEVIPSSHEPTGGKHVIPKS